MMELTEDTKTTIINKLQLLRLSWESGRKHELNEERIGKYFLFKA